MPRGRPRIYPDERTRWREAKRRKSIAAGRKPREYYIKTDEERKQRCAGHANCKCPECLNFLLSPFDRLLISVGKLSRADLLRLQRACKKLLDTNS